MSEIQEQTLPFLEETSMTAPQLQDAAHVPLAQPCHFWIFG